jgi:hypothetical protein
MVERLVKLDSRISRGAFVDAEELREAEVEAGHIRRWRR